jgi:hypothetical protein
MLKIITMITKFILVLVLLFASCNQSINLKAITGSDMLPRTELYKESLKVLKLAMINN